MMMMMMMMHSLLRTSSSMNSRKTAPSEDSMNLSASLEVATSISASMDTDRPSRPPNESPWDAAGGHPSVPVTSEGISAGMGWPAPPGMGKGKGKAAGPLPLVGWSPCGSLMGLPEGLVGIRSGGTIVSMSPRADLMISTQQTEKRSQRLSEK
eukprot:scaffold321513_cov24-Prasinocladus_malaysianus.AAC.1